LYPSDVELKRVAIEAWNVLSKMNLVSKIIWEIRGRSSLGVLDKFHRVFFFTIVVRNSSQQPPAVYGIAEQLELSNLRFSAP